MSKLSPREVLHRLQDAVIEDLMATSDEDLRKEAEEDGEDIEEIAAEVRAKINATIQKFKPIMSSTDYERNHMPVLNTEAGIDCIDCGHCVVVKTRENAEELAAELKWEDGNPVCPECGSSTTFHDYIDG